MVQLTSKRAMTKQEILSEVSKLGYRFTTKDPVNSLNAVLYGKNPKFKHAGGKFSSAGVQAKPSQSGPGGGLRKPALRPAAPAKVPVAVKAG